MDRRMFLRLGAGGVAAAMLPAAGCAPGATPSVEPIGGPVAIASDGTRVELRPDGHHVLIDGVRVGRLGTALGQFNYPAGVAILAERAYVLELGNHRITVIDLAAKAAIATIGDGELLYPGGIAVTEGGELLVADSRNGRIVGFDPNGDMTRSFGDGVLSAPRGLVAVGKTVLVADPGLRRVIELDGAGLVRRDYRAEWVLPYDVATDGEMVYAVDAAQGELLAFERKGRALPGIALDRPARFVRYAAGTLYVG